MTGSRAGLKSIAFLLLVLSAAMLPFQNCYQNSKSRTDTMASGGNGSGYDGKTFVHISEYVCADGRGYDSSITGANGMFYLTRDNCADIPTASQSPVYVQINPANPSQLVYGDRVYIEQLIQMMAFRPAAGNAGYLSSGNLYAVRNGTLTVEGAYIGRFDDAGAPLWVKRPPVIGIQEQQLSRPLADGGAILSVRYVESVSAPEKTWITRLSPSGGVMWKKTLSVAGATVRFNDMEIDSTGGVFLSGTVLRADRSQVAAFARLDLNGALSYVRTFDYPGGSAARIQFSPAGVLYMTGKVGANPFIARLNADGTQSWMKVYAGWTDLSLVFADDGAMIVKGRVSRPVPNTDLTETFERYAELNTDGSVKVVLKLSNETWSRYQQGKLYRSGDGALYTTLPLSANSFTVLRLRRDLSVEWAYTVPLTDQLAFVWFERLRDGSFAAQLTKKSSLAPFTTDFLVPLDIAKIPVTCTACTAVTAQTIGADELISVSEGPAFINLPGLTSTAATPDTLADVELRLPFAELK